MSGQTAEAATGSRRIAYGAVQVLAHLHERDAICSVQVRETDLAESSAYQWLTELEEAGTLEAETTRRPNARPAVRYHLSDEELGAAAQVLVDRLVHAAANPGPVPED